MTDAVLAQGATISFDGSPVAEVTNYDLGISADETDVTSHDSPDRFREFIPALKDPGEFPITVNWVADVHEPYFTGVGDTENEGALIVTLPNAAAVYSCTAWIKSLTIHGPADGAAQTADIVFRVTGPWTPAS